MVIIMLVVQLPVLTLLPAPVNALTYAFSCKEEDVVVHVLQDGGIDIDYSITFVNYGSLDGIDIGLPNRFYDKGSARASISVGSSIYPQTNIEKSPYVPIGLAVNLDSTVRNIIEQPGTTFTLNLHVKNPHMVYENELKSGTVGIKFRPTWFDTNSQRGATGKLSVKVFFPPSFADIPSAVYLQGHMWDTIYMDHDTGMVVAIWNRTNVGGNAQSNGDYDVGVGFPKQYVSQYFKHDWWEDLQNSFAALGDLCITTAPCLIFGVIFAGVFVFAYVSQRKRAKDYFEPKLSVVGAGPRRDLTAVEAAVVLERPLSMVATMILFGLLKKGRLEVIEDNPIRLKRLATSGDYEYETDYINSISPTGLMDRIVLQDTLVTLVNATQTKIQGFDYEATKAYYKGICERAWAQVRAAGTPEEFSQGLDKMNEWMMLDDHYYNRMDSVYVGLPYYVSGPGPTPGTHTGHVGSVWGKGGGFDPQQSAQRYISQVKSASRNLTSNMKALSQDVTTKTNPMPVSSGHGGGGGGGCACACACACAGGGR
jgi:hypothetical protein